MMIISFIAVYDKLKGFNSNCWKPDEMRHNGKIVFKLKGQEKIISIVPPYIKWIV